MSLIFKQIATSSSSDADGNETENLYGLTNDGEVYFYHFEREGWVAMTMEEAAPKKPDTT